jgi:hypothetical protein
MIFAVCLLEAVSNMSVNRIHGVTSHGNECFRFLAVRETVQQLYDFQLLKKGSVP